VGHYQISFIYVLHLNKLVHLP